MDEGMLSFASDVTAPDGSEIRLAGAVRGGSLVECTLLPGKISSAVHHRTVEELWLVVAGQGEVWRKLRNEETVTAASPGVWLSIPLGAHFQFRNTGDTPLKIVIATMPPWPGEDEAVHAKGPWRAV